jgi:hypothetical protein
MSPSNRRPAHRKRRSAARERRLSGEARRLAPRKDEPTEAKSDLARVKGSATK